MKNISKNYFELKIVQSDKISKVDTFALKKLVSFDLRYDILIESLGQKIW